MTFVVTIGSDPTPFEIYGGDPAAVHYLLAGISDGAVAFQAMTPDQRARVLIQATRLLDAQSWQGQPTTPAVAGTTLQWPRTGVIDANGNAVDSSTVPTNVVSAAFELAALLADDPDIAASVDAGSNIQSVGAGSAKVAYFAPTSALDGTAPLLPPVIQRLVAQYMGSAIDNVGGGIVTGNTSNDDSDRHRWDRSWPF